MDDEPGSGADDIGVCGMVGVARRANSWILLITFYIDVKELFEIALQSDIQNGNL